MPPLLIRRPRLTRRHVLLGAPSLLLARSAAAGVGLPDHLVPPQQLAFGRVIDDYYVRAARVTDAAARRRLVRERGRALRSAIEPGAIFERWICTRYMAARGSGESLFVVLGIAGPRTKASVSFDTMDLSGRHPVAIGAGSELGMTLLSMKERSVFLASGALFADADGGLIDGSGMGIRSTEAAEFSAPAFLMRLDRAEQPAWLDDLMTGSR